MGLYSAMMTRVHGHAKRLEQSGELDRMFNQGDSMATTRNQHTIQLPDDLEKAQVAYRKAHNLPSFNAFVLDLIRKAVGGKK